MHKSALSVESVESGLSSDLGNIVFDNLHPTQADSSREIENGLNLKQKFINPKFFYDTRGSELFEQITSTPEYYPTRIERSILENNAEAIANCCGLNCVLIEPGSGSSEKVRLLLDQIEPSAYVPIDIAAEFLQRSAKKLAEEFPWLNVHAVCADFAVFGDVPERLPEGKRVIFYPGSTLGNMIPDEAQQFLRYLRGWLGHDGGALIGIDLHKSADILNLAYNDKQGVTAAFNINVLNNINHLTNANFKTDNFEHYAFYNEEKQRIEMHLVSVLDHIVRLGDNAIAFSEGESIHTENSYKYTLESFRELIEGAGFVIKSSWLDEDQLFSVHYLELDGRDIENQT